MTPVSQSSPPSCCHTVAFSAAANCHFSVRSTQWFQNQLFNWFFHWAHQESHSTSHPSTLHSSTSLSWAVLRSCVSTPLVGYFCMAHGVTTSCEMMLQQWGSSHQRLLSYLFNCSCYAQIKKKRIFKPFFLLFSPDWRITVWFKLQRTEACSTDLQKFLIVCPVWYTWD